MIRSPGELERFIHHWAVIPKLLWSNPPHYGFTLLTATFLHGSWIHILSNILFLHVFGGNVEGRMGHFRYLLFYLLCGVLANGTQAFFIPGSVVPLIGASGAIAGVLGSYFFYYPYAKVETLIPILFFITIREVPAFIFLGFWFLLQTLNGSYSITAMTSGHSMGGIAFIAHVAGFVIGLVMAPAFARQSGRSR